MKRAATIIGNAMSGHVVDAGERSSSVGKVVSTPHGDEYSRATEMPGRRTTPFESV